MGSPEICMHTVPVHSEPQLRVYVLTAARNTALDLLPGKTRREVHLDVGTLSAESGGDLFEALVNRQDYDNLLALIRSLPMVYREVLMLRYVMELEPREISTVLSRKVGTVSQQITRGKKLLLAAYEREACSS